MKKIIVSAAVAIVSLSAGAQIHYQDAKNPDVLRHASKVDAFRQEIILPQVNGYNVYKADLHVHTLFSDGTVMPNLRVQESWEDGLDIIAITDHIETRKAEEVMVPYLKNYVKEEYPEALNTFIALEPTPKGSIMVDLNIGVKLAQLEAPKYGLLIIPGAEISRCGATIGHFNALFTTDINEIYDPDPLTCIRNAKAQGALVMQNHPGYRRTNIEPSEVERQAFAEGLFDGIEVMNGSSFYPGIIDKVQDKGLFIAAGTDVHGSSASKYRHGGNMRTMTLILAKEKTLESVREALEAGRTLALGYETICGEEQLLKDFFAAGMKVEVIRETKSGVELSLTNMTSLPYILTQNDGNWLRLQPFTTLRFKVGKDAKTLDLEVLNMFCRADKHPVVQLMF